MFHNVTKVTKISYPTVFNGTFVTFRLDRDWRQRMSYIPREKVLKNGVSIFKLTLLAARRAIELSNGAQKLVDSNSKNFSIIALEEIAQGRLSYKERK